MALCAHNINICLQHNSMSSEAIGFYEVFVSKSLIILCLASDLSIYYQWINYEYLHIDIIGTSLYTDYNF